MFTKGHNHGDHGGRPAASGDGALTGAWRRPRTGPACRCSCPPGSGTAGGRRPWPCRSRSSLGKGERTGQGPLAATGVRKGHHVRVQGRPGGRAGWTPMGREGEKRDISSAPTIRLALNTDREGHEADPTFTAEEAQAGTRGAPRPGTHAHLR